MQLSNELLKKINDRVNQTINMLPLSIRHWALEHLVSPFWTVVHNSHDSCEKSCVIQITGRTGNDDSSYDVFFDAEEESFGLLCTTHNGIRFILHYCDDFADAVMSM
jgi:hypothetical protein